MNTLVLAPFTDAGLASLRELGDVTYEPWTATQMLHDPEELGERLTNEGFDALVVEADFLFEDLFESANSLRFAAICRAALNQVDLDAATEQGVVIVHAPGRNAQAVAELVLGHLLSLARHIPASARYVANGQWQDPTEAYTRFQGRELTGATLGLVGLGQIGSRVAKLSRGIGMRRLAYDPYVMPGSRAAPGVEICSLKRLLTESDFVSVHVPENDETTNLIGARQLALMRSNAYLVNVTSPAVVNVSALADALRTGAIAGAAMDVHESHPIAPDSPLLGLPNVILTPHIGGATVESIERHSAMVVEDIRRFVAGKRPKRLANLPVWSRRR
jgi:D-3-phosphoglycerate dehydrogenase